MSGFVRLTSKLPLHVHQLVDHQSLSDSVPGQRCVVLPPLRNTVINVRKTHKRLLVLSEGDFKAQKQLLD